MCADVALVVNLQVNVWEVSWRAVSKLFSFLQARISSSTGLLLLDFSWRREKNGNFLSRREFWDREKEREKGPKGVGGRGIPFKGHHLKISTAKSAKI